MHCSQLSRCPPQLCSNSGSHSLFSHISTFSVLYLSTRCLLTFLLSLHYPAIPSVLQSPHSLHLSFSAHLPTCTSFSHQPLIDRCIVSLPVCQSWNVPYAFEFQSSNGVGPRLHHCKTLDTELIQCVCFCLCLNPNPRYLHSLAMTFNCQSTDTQGWKPRLKMETNITVFNKMKL